MEKLIRTVKKFVRSAHIIVPVELIGKEVEIRLLGENSEIPDKVDTKKEYAEPEQEPKQLPKEELKQASIHEQKQVPVDDYKTLMGNLLKSHPQQ